MVMPLCIALSSVVNSAAIFFSIVSIVCHCLVVYTCGKQWSVQILFRSRPAKLMTTHAFTISFYWLIPALAPSSSIFCCLDMLLSQRMLRSAEQPTVAEAVTSTVPYLYHTRPQGGTKFMTWACGGAMTRSPTQSTAAFLR